MKTKINALAIYMASADVIKWITSKNLDLQDEIREKIDFLKLVEWKEINIKWYDDENVFISQYDNSKKYQFKLDILESESESEDEEKIENSLLFNPRRKMFIAYFIIGMFLSLIFLFLYLNYFESKKDSEDVTVTQFELNYKRINDINLIIASELNIQKEARQIEKDSIKKVWELEKEQIKIRFDTLNLSHNIK